jgi:hypothetical protein
VTKEAERGQGDSLITAATMEKAAKELQEMIYKDQEDEIEVLLDRNPELIKLFCVNTIYDISYNYTP